MRSNTTSETAKEPSTLILIKSYQVQPLITAAFTYLLLFFPMYTQNHLTAVTGLSYFEDDEEESSSNVDLPYIPAENSPTRQQMQPGGGSDSEDDPLDAFMAEVEVRLHLPLTPQPIIHLSIHPCYIPESPR